MSRTDPRGPRPTLAPKLAALAGAAQVALLTPPAAANSFNGVGVYLAAIYVGIPAAVIVLGLLVASVVLLRREGAPTPGRLVFGRIALWTPLALVVLDVGGGLALETTAYLQALAGSLLFSLPLLVLTLATVLVAARLIRRNRPSPPSG